MPLYEFICASCGKKFEELCRTSEQTDVRCPACGSEKAARQLSAFACKGGGSSCGGSCSGGSCSSCH
ncbi:MAG TPA: FmdB family transcriptional regulator [Firmicutes bacterium]|nr:FmdB family transcriptional regulator [Bacillota bacterium]HAW70249.1 FmdB family transcriptional regulator [Bacillota bacterium]HAZ21520.1 FmdB family transcriptional regulator [Bacillota bacterium]HBE06556.1 FmdB family transcriptional regulator [Bacillota bacterium]HBG44695.1 FmdB family transcriptional regulator [Bacillota bacterium]